MVSPDLDAIDAVGRTAIAVARVRATESARPDALFDDPLAGAFAAAADDDAPAVGLRDAAAALGRDPGRELAAGFAVAVRAGARSAAR